jgi:replicative DNA helicase
MNRAPPHNEQAERGLISAMMESRDVLSECVDRITPWHFFIPAHQTIFDTLVELYKANKPIDLITFTDYLRDKNILDSVGGVSYVTEVYMLASTEASTAFAQQYREIVQEKYLLRSIITRCTEMIRVCYEEAIEMRQAVEQAQATLTEIIMESERADVFRHVKEGIPETLDRLETAHAHRGQASITGLATGVIDFDRMTGGLKPQQLIVVGARPSQGKTALAMNFAANLACKNMIPVGVFSMEMSFSEVVDRLFASMSGISLQRFRDGFLSEKDFRRAPEEASKIMDAPLWIDDTPALSITSFKARARLMKVRHRVQVIVVDYLQLMRSTSKRAEDARWLEITEISATLKAVSKELKIPIIACAQLNREAEQREFGKPKLSDLRESGSIEQDADIVVMLWRPERHIQHPKVENKKVAKLLGLKSADGIELWPPDDELTKGQVEERNRQIKEYAGFLVLKHRNGPVNNLRLRFIGELTRFENTTDKMWSNREEERQQV